MACMKLGSKSDVFHCDGSSWLCSSGLPSDVEVQVKDMIFHLHKFPLLSRSRVLESIIGDKSVEDESRCVVQLHEIPGGAKTFLLVAKFCYGVRIELTASNVVTLRCAAEYLRMTENYGDRNLMLLTETFLDEILGSWTDSVKALGTCEEVLPYAEKLHIVSRCISSLAMKACVDPSLFSWPVSGVQSPEGTSLWNGIRAATTKTQPDVSADWWFNDVSSLSLTLYKRFILTVVTQGMKPEKISSSIIHYAERHLPLLTRNTNFQNGEDTPSSDFSSPYSGHETYLLEEIVELIPTEKGITPTKFLLRLLRTSVILQASSACRENLEKRIGAQLDQAALEDLLIPNTGYSAETLYDVDCFQRILDHFMLVDRDPTDSSITLDIVDEAQIVEGSHSLTPMTMVANLIDGYLAEVAPDVNLKLPKFQSVAAVVPEHARALDDGIYRAIDIYLKAHPWLVDSEKEQLCQLMNCQKLSLEAATHAAQNERLPLRVIVQVLFFEQLRLRTSMAGWFSVSDNMNDNSQNLSGTLAVTRTNGCPIQDHIVAVHDVNDRISELEQECLRLKQNLEKLDKTKGAWSMLLKKLGFKLKPKVCDDPKPPMPQDSDQLPLSTPPLMNPEENQISELKEEQLLRN